MFELGNVHNQTVYIFAETIENEAISQISNMANSPLGKDAHIAIMPDAHAGAGCTIGTTMKIHDKVCPNLVGVDVGCLDKDTEILTTSGWIKISEYCDESILIYDKNSDTAYFEKPLAYIKAPCDHFNYFVSKKGLNQMLSDEHKMLIWRGYRGRWYRQVIAQASDVFQAHNQNTKSDRAIKTTFQLQQTELPISDEMIRVLVMVSADGCIQHNKKKPMSRCAFHFKKSRKIQRAKTLLESAHISYRCYTGKDGSYYIYTSMPREVTKSLKQFYRASQRQLEIFIDEIYHWDGTIDTQRNHKMFVPLIRQMRMLSNLLMLSMAFEQVFLYQSQTGQGVQTSTRHTKFMRHRMNMLGFQIVNFSKFQVRTVINIASLHLLDSLSFAERIVFLLQEIAESRCLA